MVAGEFKTESRETGTTQQNNTAQFHNSSAHVRLVLCYVKCVYPVPVCVYQYGCTVKYLKANAACNTCRIKRTTNFRLDRLIICAVGRQQIERTDITMEEYMGLPICKTH